MVHYTRHTLPQPHFKTKIRLQKHRDNSGPGGVSRPDESRRTGYRNIGYEDKRFPVQIVDKRRARVLRLAVSSRRGFEPDHETMVGKFANHSWKSKHSKIGRAHV